MGTFKSILGIDAGSVAVGLAVVTPDREIVQTAYRFHRGDVRGCVLKLLEEVNLSLISHVAATASVPHSLLTQRRYNNEICCITACKYLHPGKPPGMLLLSAAKNSVFQPSTGMDITWAVRQTLHAPPAPAVFSTSRLEDSILPASRN